MTMKIIKDKRIIDDNWHHIADEAELTSGKITVSLSRWKQDQTELKEYQGEIGVRLLPSDFVGELVEDLDQLNLVVLEFPAFTDGRSFTQAKLLRDRYVYQGEIRAIGGYMPDQVFYLTRVGVNAFELEKTELLELALETMDDFTVKYQESVN